MKVYRVVLMVVDHDNLGGKGIMETLESQRYPNHCMSPSVMDIVGVDIGEWRDDHPLNLTATVEQEFERLFSMGEIGE